MKKLKYLHVSKSIVTLPNGQNVPGPGSTYNIGRNAAKRTARAIKGRRK